MPGIWTTKEDASPRRKVSTLDDLHIDSHLCECQRDVLSHVELLLVRTRDVVDLQLQTVGVAGLGKQ